MHSSVNSPGIIKRRDIKPICVIIEQQQQLSSKSKTNEALNLKTNKQNKIEKKL